MWAFTACGGDAMLVLMLRVIVAQDCEAVSMSALPPPGAWDIDPAVIGVARAAAAGYVAAMGPWRARLGIAEEDRRKRAIYFAVGWLTLVLALVSPLDMLGRYYLFAAHTVQLLVITTVSAPFLLLGLPERLVELLLPLRALREATRALLFPVIAGRRSISSCWSGMWGRCMSAGCWTTGRTIWRA